MDKILLVLKREYITEVRKKSFIIMTLLGPFLMAALVGFIVLMMKINQSETHLALIDDNQIFGESIKSDENLKIFPFSNAQLKTLTDSLANSQTLDGIVYIPKAKDNTYKSIETDIMLYSNKNISKDVLMKVSGKIDDIIKKQRIKDLNITEEDLETLQPNTTFTIKNVTNNKEEKDNELRYFISMFLMYITMMFIIINGVKVMRSVLEEKNNRVVEIIISSIKPFQLMMGKILGTALVALTQLAIWIVMFLIILLVMNIFLISPEEIKQIQTLQPNQLTDNQMTMINISNSFKVIMNLNIPLIIFIFLFYFFVGYLLYSAFFAAIGAAVDNETETQQFTMLAVIPLTLGAYGCFSILNNPEGPASFWLSIIPITSPLAMVTRSTFDVPLWQLVLSMILLLFSVFGMVVLAAKIYRTGILMYGKKVNFKELWKWAKM